MKNYPYTLQKRKEVRPVPFDFSSFFTNIMEAKYDFAAIGEWVASVYETVVANATILDIWNDGMSSLSFLAPYLSVLFLLGSLSVAFFGKRLAEPVKFISIFVIAFCLGVCYISPLLDPFVELPHWIMGLIVAAVSAVLYKFIYVALVAFVIGYSAYMIVLRPDVLTPFLGGNTTAALVVAVIVLLTVFLLRKYTEIIGFALFGGWLTALSIRGLYDYSVLLGENGYILVIILTLLVAVPGFIIQLRMRKRF